MDNLTSSVEVPKIALVIPAAIVGIPIAIITCRALSVAAECAHDFIITPPAQKLLAFLYNNRQNMLFKILFITSIKIFRVLDVTTWTHSWLSLSLISRELRVGTMFPLDIHDSFLNVCAQKALQENNQQDFNWLLWFGAKPNMCIGYKNEELFTLLDATPPEDSMRQVTLFELVCNKIEKSIDAVAMAKTCLNYGADPNGLKKIMPCSTVEQGVKTVIEPLHLILKTNNLELFDECVKHGLKINPFLSTKNHQIAPIYAIMRHKNNGKEMFYHILRYTTKINKTQLLENGNYALTLVAINRSCIAKDVQSIIRNMLVNLYFEDYRKNESEFFQKNLRTSFELGDSNPWINAPSKIFATPDKYKVDRDHTAVYKAIKKLEYLSTPQITG